MTLLVCAQSTWCFVAHGANILPSVLTFLGPPGSHRRFRNPTHQPKFALKFAFSVSCPTKIQGKAQTPNAVKLSALPWENGTKNQNWLWATRIMADNAESWPWKCLITPCNAECAWNLWCVCMEMLDLGWESLTLLGNALIAWCLKVSRMKAALYHPPPVVDCPLVEKNITCAKDCQKAFVQQEASAGDEACSTTTHVISALAKSLNRRRGWGGEEELGCVS